MSKVTPRRAARSTKALRRSTARLQQEAARPQGGSVTRRGTSATSRVAMVVFLFLIAGVFMDSLHHWHFLHMLMKH